MPGARGDWVPYREEVHEWRGRSTSHVYLHEGASESVVAPHIAQDGWTPLMIASTSGRLDLAQALLAARANMEPKGDVVSGWGIGLRLVRSQGCHYIFGKAQSLLGDNNKYNRHVSSMSSPDYLWSQMGRRPLYLAVENAHIEVVQALLTAGADVEAKANVSSAGAYWVDGLWVMAYSS